MRHREKLIISLTAGLLLIALYFVIFTFSEQDGEVSGSLSTMITRKCIELINSLTGRHWTEAVMRGMTEYFEHPVRKAAHFGEYAVMGTLLYGLWRPWMRRGKGLFGLIVVWVFLSAAADEFHQIFIPGRDGNFMDVLLDTAGGAFGMGVCVAAEKLFWERKGFSLKRKITKK